MKRMLSLFLAFCMVLGMMGTLLTLPATAAYDYEQGKAIAKTLPAVWLIRFAPTDVTGAVAIRFDFFIDNAANFRLSAIEFGSHKNNDWQEFQFAGTGAWPKLQNGWNSVTLRLSDAEAIAAVDPKDGSDGKFDYKTFQRIRIFNITSTDPAITIGFRNVVAVMADGTEIPVGSVAAGGEDTPAAREQITDLTVQPGSDETSLRFNWIAAEQPEKVTVEMAPMSGDFDTVKTVTEGTFAMVTGNVQIVGNDIVGTYACKVNVTGLKAGTVYRYRVSTGSADSELHTVVTQDGDEVHAYILSDIHVIEHPSWGKKLQVSVDNWQTTLNQLVERDEANLILSMGDQMQDTTSQAYLDGFFGVENLADVLFAPLNGNHDLSPASSNLRNYTNVPNTVYPNSMGISDYYFKSGNVLFVMLSLTDINYDEVDHEKTFKEAVAAYPDYDWMVVGMHEAIYGYYLKDYTAAAGDALDYCNEKYGKYIEIIDKYSPDLCFTGHSHSYCRSYFMQDGEVQSVTEDADGTVVDPTGTLYINMGTSSRMSEFGNQDPTPNWPWSFIAFSIHGHASYTYGFLETEGETLSLVVWDNLEPDKVLDTVTIRKTEIGNKATTTPTVSPTQAPAASVTPTDTPTPTESPDSGSNGTLTVIIAITAVVLFLGGAAFGVVLGRRKK